MSFLAHLKYCQISTEWTHLVQSKHSGFRLDLAPAKVPSMETFWADENRCWPGFGHVFFPPFSLVCHFYSHAYFFIGCSNVCTVSKTNNRNVCFLI